MMPLKSSALAILFSLAATAGAWAAPKTYTIDPEHALVAFKVDHIGYAKVLGQFLTVEGNFIYNESTQELGTVAVDVDAGSVFSNHERRDDHIRGKDFLWAAETPVITFRATGGTVTSPTTGTVTGDLTIRGETRPMTLDVTLNKAGPYPFGHKKHTLGISATGTLKRSDWGMTYALGGIVGDEVDLIIEVEAIRQD